MSNLIDLEALFTAYFMRDTSVIIAGPGVEMKARVAEKQSSVQGPTLDCQASSTKQNPTLSLYLSMYYCGGARNNKPSWSRSCDIRIATGVTSIYRISPLAFRVVQTASWRKRNMPRNRGSNGRDGMTNRLTDIIRGPRAE